eukprot:scaffold142727_cov32-Tisochrysis_lutea.AAC.1
MTVCAGAFLRNLVAKQVLTLKHVSAATIWNMAGILTSLPLPLPNHVRATNASSSARHVGLFLLLYLGERVVRMRCGPSTVVRLPISVVPRTRTVLPLSPSLRRGCYRWSSIRYPLFSFLCSLLYLFTTWVELIFT